MVSERTLVCSETLPAFSRAGRSVRPRSASTVSSPERLSPGGASGSQRTAITRTSGPKCTAAPFSARNGMTLPVSSMSTVVSRASR